MKRNSTFTKALFILFAVIFVLACNAGGLGATATPAPTNTPAATNTPLPTNTPESTATPVEPTATLAPPTPAPIGSVIRSDNFEVKVVIAQKRDRVYPGGKFYFTPASGYMMVDIGVKVKNLTNSPVTVTWNDVYVMNGNGDWWYPSWGTWEKTSDDLDPFTIGVSEIEIIPESEIVIDNDGYFRLFYHIPTEETYYFGFFDAALTEIHFK